MAIKLKPSAEEQKTARLRALRLANEAARKEAGTWGQVTVGEVVHEGSQSVFLHAWKGARRPDLLLQGPRRPGISAADWEAMVAWMTRLRSLGFSKTILARDLSLAEARKVIEARVAEHRAGGYTVINSVEAS